ncbi:MAG TPA: DNA cytosine methyltransferase [Acetobacteraceae bacterium]|jgi:hypothetical protein|nr:DNA cytosine methyltransferase [Acetobacteraceae bacterium]
MKPLAIDLFAGLGGWADGLLAEGFDVIGFDIERHQYGEHRYPAQLVIQDVLTLHGSQFRDAALIVASPPCQAYSYRAMPWSRAKALPPPDNALFEACFRIQREASEAAGRRVPLIVENVRGAQPWVGRARWNFGSYYLWGDVPALMPITHNRLKGGQTNWRDHDKSGYRGDQLQDHFKSQGMNWSDRTIKGQDFTRIAGRQRALVCDCQCPEPVSGVALVSMECPIHNWNPDPSPPESGRKGVPHRTKGHWTNPAEHEGGTKHPETGHAWYRTGPGRFPSSPPRRKAASAMIAKIPLPLARHIAATFRPEARP